MKCTKKLNDSSKSDVFKKATYWYDSEPSVKSIVDFNTGNVKLKVIIGKYPGKTLKAKISYTPIGKFSSKVISQTVEYSGKGKPATYVVDLGNKYKFKKG